MTNDGSHRDQFDRFAQDAYLKILLDTDPDAITPTLFLDMMNRVNMLEGQVSLILTELDHSPDAQVNLNHIEDISIELLGGTVDLSNILKAMMEHYELKHRPGPQDDADIR
jgi:hypothetical protein